MWFVTYAHVQACVALNELNDLSACSLRSAQRRPSRAASPSAPILRPSSRPAHLRVAPTSRAARASAASEATHTRSWALGRRAPLRRGALAAARARGANGLPEPHEHLVDVWPQVPRHPRLERAPRGLGRARGRPAEPVGHAVHVQVHSNALGAPPRHRHRDVCHLRAHAGQRAQLRGRARDVCTMCARARLVPSRSPARTVIVLGVQHRGRLAKVPAGALVFWHNTRRARPSVRTHCVFLLWKPTPAMSACSVGSSAASRLATVSPPRPRQCSCMRATVAAVVASFVCELSISATSVWKRKSEGGAARSASVWQPMLHTQSNASRLHLDLRARAPHAVTHVSTGASRLLRMASTVAQTRCQLSGATELATRGAEAAAAVAEAATADAGAAAAAAGARASSSTVTGARLRLRVAMKTRPCTLVTGRAASRRQRRSMPSARAEDNLDRQPVLTPVTGEQMLESARLKCRERETVSSGQRL